MIRQITTNGNDAESQGDMTARIANTTISLAHQERRYNDEPEYDFGFTTVGKDSLDVPLKTKLSSKLIPFLKKLAVDDGREYLHWPNRTKEMNKLIKELENILNV